MTSAQRYRFGWPGAVEAELADDAVAADQQPVVPTAAVGGMRQGGEGPSCSKDRLWRARPGDMRCQTQAKGRRPARRRGGHRGRRSPGASRSPPGHSPVAGCHSRAPDAGHRFRLRRRLPIEQASPAVGPLIDSADAQLLGCEPHVTPESLSQLEIIAIGFRHVRAISTIA